MKTTNTFKAEVRPMSNVLFQNDVRYRIPRYQRPYAWTEDDVTDFWNDIHEEHNLFIGSMIFNYEHQVSENYIDVIDGQQRLLTITIMQAVLRDLARGFDEKVAERLHRWGIGLEDQDGIYDHRIRCGDTTRTFFEKHIQSEFDGRPIQAKTSSPEERRIRRNYAYFRKRVLENLERFDSATGKLDEIRSIRNKIRSLLVIHVEIGSEEEAYEIFETTNARGVDLTVADLVKNLIFKKIKMKDGYDQAKEKWEDIQDNVRESGIELKRFIRYYWMSKFGICPEKKLFREIKTNTFDWQGLLDGLHSDSYVFLNLVRCNETYWKKMGVKDDVIKALSGIQRMGFGICYVFLLRLFSNIGGMNVDPIRIVRSIERFTFLYSAVCRGVINRCERIYSEFACELQGLVEGGEAGPEEFGSVLGRLEKELVGIAPKFEVFNESFSEIAYKRGASRGLTYFILDRVNSHVSPTDEMKVAQEFVSTEHVLPQSPEKAWKLSTKDVARYVHLLGNLTLVDRRINSEAGNGSLGDKLEVLKESALPITEKLVSEISSQKCPYWDEGKIRERQGKLAKMAYDEVWRLPVAND